MHVLRTSGLRKPLMKGPNRAGGLLKGLSIEVRLGGLSMNLVCLVSVLSSTAGNPFFVCDASLDC
jgi:hypothetical protein